MAAAFPRRTIALRLLAVNTTASVYARAQKFDKALGSLGAASALAAQNDHLWASILSTKGFGKAARPPRGASSTRVEGIAPQRSST